MKNRNSHKTFFGKPLTLGDIAFVLSVLYLAATRFVLLSKVPGIYPDEANFLEFSHNILRHRFEWGLFTHTFLPRLPLPLILSGIAETVLGPSIVAIRSVTAIAGIAAAVLVFLVSKKGDRRSMGAWVAMLFMISHPFVLFYNRWGFTYNLLPVFSMVTLFYCLVPDSSPWQLHRTIAISLLVALAMLTEPISIALFFSGLVAVFFRDRRRVFLYSAISFGPLIAYLGYLWLVLGETFSSDLQAILKERLAAPVQIHGVALGAFVVGLWQSQGWSLCLGFFGLPFLPGRLRRYCIFQFLAWTTVIMLHASNDYTLIVRESIVLFPLSALGWGALVDRIGRRLYGAIRRDAEILIAIIRFGRSRTVALVAVSLLAGVGGYWLLILPIRAILAPESAANPLTMISVEDVDALSAATTFLEKNTGPKDLVLGDHLPRLLRCTRASIMQMAVVEGAEGNPFFPLDEFRNRRISNARFTDTKFAVLTPYNYRIETSFPGVSSLIEQIRKWPRVFVQGDIAIYANPALQPSADMQ